MRALLVIALALAATTVHAKPGVDQPDKGDAKALLSSGLKLFAAKDYLGALAVFRDAYERFPSPKILLNIGTTLKALGRDADAANVYQRYLDAPDSEAAKKADVAKVVAELDAKVALLEITVAPQDAEIQIGNEGWQSATAVARYRVTPGRTTIRARRDGHLPTEKAVNAAAGVTATLSLQLAPDLLHSHRPTTIAATAARMQKSRMPTPARASNAHHRGSACWHSRSSTSHMPAAPRASARASGSQAVCTSRVRR